MLPVEIFLKGKLEFLRIFEVLESVLTTHTPVPEPSLEQIFAADEWAREEARRRL